MFHKIDVNGDGACDLYKWLKAEQPGEEESAEIKWNFAKFIVDKEGKAIARFSPMTTPEELQAEVAKYLSAQLCGLQKRTAGVEETLGASFV